LHLAKKVCGFVALTVCGCQIDAEVPFLEIHVYVWVSRESGVEIYRFEKWRDVAMTLTKESLSEKIRPRNQSW